MNRNFLPAMLCVRRPPNLDSRRLYKFAAIRCFILIKAIDFQLQDSRQDKSIKEISDFVRQGGDWSGDRRKIRWLMGLIPSSLDLGDFRTNLEISIQSAETDVAGTTDALRALRHLTTDSRRPIESSTDAKRFSDVAGTNFSSFLHTENAATGHYFASFRQYDTTTTIDVPKSASPPEVSRLARIIAFQDAEDQQYLSYSWNRARREERAALFKALAAEMAIRPVVSKKIDVDQTKLMAAIAIVALICQGNSA